MDKKIPELAERLARLPVCPRRKILIPYANLTTSAGDPDFTVLDSAKVHRIARDRVCGVCGFPLGYWIAFLGGPRCAQARAYVDPPMHEDCAHTALRLCPYLSREGMQRRKSQTPEAISPPGFHDDKPAAYLLYITRAYKYAVTADGVIFHPSPAVRLEQCRYTQGRIGREGSI